MSDFVTQARFALRMLVRHKRFSALAILSLGVAISLNTTMYSVLDTLISPKIAMREPSRLYGFFFYGDFRNKIPQNEKNEAYRNVSFAEEITGVGGTPLGDQYLQRGSALREARVQTIMPNYFRVLGNRASAGRLLNETDVDAPGRPVVISERLWNQMFADVGAFQPTTYTTGNGETRLVVGLLAFEADLPGRFIDVWQLPKGSDLSKMTPTIARLKQTVSPEQAAAELEGLRKRFAQQTGELLPGDAGFRMVPVVERSFKMFGFHYALIGAVLAVLLIGCANLANLQLARGVARARELATRTAVGASRRDIILQLVIESGWLALGGLILGGILTAWSMHLVNANVPPQVAEYITRAQLSWRVMLFAVFSMLVCLVLMGLLPAIRVSRVNINELLKAGSGTGKSRSSRRQYGGLVIAEISLALALLCVASMMMKSAIEVFTFEPGFEEKGLLMTFVATQARDSSDHRTVRQAVDEAIGAARLTPKVTHATVTQSGYPRRHSISTEAAGITEEHQLPPMWGYSIVTDDYFATMGMPIIKGRDFSPGETVPAAIVDDRTASFLWPGANPIGRMIKLDSGRTKEPWLQVIGVVKRSNRWFLESDYDRAMALGRGLGRVYVLLGNDTTRLSPPGPKSRYVYFELSARTTDDALKTGLTMRGALFDRGYHAGVPRSGAQTTGIARLREKHGFMTSLFSTFAALALGLAALGVYAIIAHMVAQRTREFGVRLAVGASARDIRQLVLKESNVLALSGIALGLLVVPFSGQWVRAFVFDDYDRFDSRVFAIASITLFLTAWVASYIPARRAMRIDPVEALRND